MRKNRDALVRVVVSTGLGLALLVGASTGPAAAAPDEPGAPGPGRLVARATRAACGPSRPPCRVVAHARHRVGRGLVEDTFTLQVGTGRHDRIRLHHVARVGQQRAPERAVFLVHGDLGGFDPVFAPRRRPAARAGAADYLARRGVDVWGIDQRWVQVPRTVRSTDFMHGWGFATELSDLRVATTVVRSVRAATGARRPTMALVGWSRGGQLAYAYADRESQLPARARNVDALVPVDAAVMRYAAADEEFRRVSCASYRADRQALRAGEDAFDFSGLAALGTAALAEPGAPSGAGVTNRQLADLVGVAVNRVFNAFFHFVAPTRLDADGVPRGLQFTRERSWFRLLSRAAPRESIGTFRDGAAISCGTVKVPFGSHLSDVRLPVLSLTAAGGFGATGLHTLSLLGSTDVSTRIVRLRPAGQATRDFGHVDLWTSRRAPTLVWAPLLAWVRRH